MPSVPAMLICENGTTFYGTSFGAVPPAVSELKTASVSFSGELIFNTGMSGYVETATDPSYTGQIVLFTYPHIGNYGVEEVWSESAAEPSHRKKVKAAGFAVKKLYKGPVPAGRISFDSYLEQSGVTGIEGVDTRTLTLMLRDGGSLNGVIVAHDETPLSASETELVREFFLSAPSMAGRNLIGEVGCRRIRRHPRQAGKTVERVVRRGERYRIAVLDCGIKGNIVRELRDRGCRVTLFPSFSTAQTILETDPDAVLISNGPGDPGVLTSVIETVRSLLGKKPVFGICLGHQLIALASGASTYKMKFGHHGLNHPVRDERTGRVFVTSQNHGFAVDEKTLPKEIAVWCRNANDGTVEGLIHKTLPVMCVQFHPEACPGPTDSSWIFDAFLDKIGEVQ